MPCTYYETEEEKARPYKKRIDKLSKDNDRLTKENDELREVILAFMDDPDFVVPDFIAKRVGQAQVKHRKEDLARLESTFRDARDAERLGLVMLADPTKPLESQLGFSPDDF